MFKAPFFIEGIKNIFKKPITEEGSIEKVKAADNYRLVNTVDPIFHGYTQIENPERRTRILGWIPIESSSFTECCVGFDLSSFEPEI